MKFIFPILFLIYLPVKAQKTTQHSFEADDIQKIVLAGDEIYRIELKSVKGDQIRIFASTEGEYYNNISLDHEIKEQSLFINSRFREILQNGYDKLSAHKVFSMEVTVEIPQGMALEISSNIANVYITGAFENVLIQLKSGSCQFSDYSGEAVVNTYTGNITGEVAPAEFEVSSRHGEVQVPPNTYGMHKMVLTSINGDIKLSETK
ncbi:hypothetical protein [Salinimicrobium xinjiangense]|uniref:hypothetical protein n=1 Tax=Salinimicrobium xinjiangense TaxID=438596 RepID=UPI0004022B03|nr:hypothetical protein [Salinimicrobium xinjiangense]